MLLERAEELAAVGGLLSAGGVRLVEGGAGVGKTALVEAACQRAAGMGMEVLRARGAELEAGFAFGVVRQVFERRLAEAASRERRALLMGPARAAWSLLQAPPVEQGADTLFSVVHGLYWLSVNLAAGKRTLIAVDDAHWADAPSLQWLGYLAPRLEGLGLSLLVALRPLDPVVGAASLLALRREPSAVLRPRLLSEQAVAALASDVLGAPASAELVAQLAGSSGGNPFYLRELLRAVRDAAGSGDAAGWPAVEGVGAKDVLHYLAVRLQRIGPAAMRLAQAVAVLGDDCRLRQAAALSGESFPGALQAAAALVAGEVLASADPARFLHPIVRHAVEVSLGEARRAALHRAAAELLDGEGAPPGQVAGHLRDLPPCGDAWVCRRLRDAAGAALVAGAPLNAAELLRRAWAEPPPGEEQVAVLRELARAEVTAGHDSARARLEQALARTRAPRERARIAQEVAAAHAALFHWVAAVDVLEQAVAELADVDSRLTEQLEAELLVAALHDARRAARVAPALRRLAAAPASGARGEALAVAQGMAALFAGRPAPEVAAPLLTALADPSPVASWDTRAALLWCLITAEEFEAVDRALQPMFAQVQQTGSARGLIAVYSSLGLLQLRRGALPEADSAARIALGVLQERDFAPGLPFAVTVLADVAVEAGQLDAARAWLDLLPARDWSAGVGTVLIPAAWGRLHLAAGRPAEALESFTACARMFSAQVWGLDMRDVGYLHARSGAAQALWLFGDTAGARAFADAELADVRTFGAPRALAIALRTAGLVHGGERGLALLADSVTVLNGSPAVLERAKSLAELGAAQRRTGRRVAARQILAEALDLATHAGAGLLAARLREELRAAGARPRRDWRHGVAALTPAELRVARLAADGRSNQQIAQELYVTVKTVEGHLAHAYAKLGILGRPELPGALGAGKLGVSAP